MSPKTKTILVDNYDSFTWNVYQSLCELGADVVVFRNDKVSLEEIIALNPRNIVISPGPGSPSTSSGISMDVIRHFAGKVPILGVCLGLQCMYELYGGTVSEVGFIVHGKTSPLIHDGAGLYRGVPQRVDVTRYHSLAGTFATLPECLLITSHTDSGVIQGVRHKTFCMEGVQFHPESVISQSGQAMFANFLLWEHGTWEANNEKILSHSLFLPSDTQEIQDQTKPKESVLLKIAARRREDVLEAQRRPGQSLTDIKRLVELNIAPPLLDFYSQLSKHPASTAVLAEIKRASPSKGDININSVAAEQAIIYAGAGAAAISVLTEPTWFKGSLNDMRQARDAVAHFSARPAILRKDFIIDRYQVYESRLYGADTLLLIVAILSRETLVDLMQLSRSLGMEPLVEVNTQSEMDLAIEVGARVIGVNNRDLHTFSVDMDTTSRLAKKVPSSTILIALSGINNPDDVSRYQNSNVRAVLVGEALMRSSNPREFISSLSGYSRPVIEVPSKVHVKICGIRTVEAAVTAAKHGADFIGLIFAPSKRQVDIEQAREIINAVRGNSVTSSNIDVSKTWFEHQRVLATVGNMPKIVGVFRNQTLSEMTNIATSLNLDYIQLHGDEAVELPRLLPRPCIQVFHVGSSFTQRFSATSTHLHSLVLLDAQSKDGSSGGLGISFDWSLSSSVIVSANTPPVIIAGGLNPENVAEFIRSTRPFAVDVSSGVEIDGVKDESRIIAFIQAVREAN